MSERLDLKEFPVATPADWRQSAEDSLKGASFEKKLVTQTPEGIRLQPIYFPMTPASRIPGFRTRDLWLAQEIMGSCPSDFNARLLEDLMSGQNCVPLPMDLATRQARDPEECEPGEVGTCGLSISRLGDLQDALANVDLDAAPVLAWAGASAVPLLGLFGALAAVRKRSWRGAILADPLTELARDGKLPITLSEAWDEMSEALRWVETYAPAVKVIGVQASLWADAGGSAVDELAFAIATGVEALREVATRGVDLGVSAPRTLFGLSLGPVVFMQIAKLRAFRLLWARVIAAWGGDDRAQVAMVHGRTSVLNKSVLDPFSNMLRSSVEAFVGISGGVDSLHVAPFDEPVRKPTGFSRRIARNVPIILSEECGLMDVADPAAGSWYVESLTDELARAAWRKFQQIEEVGGMAAALRAGIPQRSVAETAKSRFDAMASRRETLVGVNFSANPTEQALAASSEAPAGRPDQRPHGASPSRILGVAGAVEAFAAGASLGQVRRALRDDGTGSGNVERVRVRGLAADYERLRKAALDWTQRTGGPPLVWLANFGPPRQFTARAEFSAGFFTAGGFDVRQGSGAQSVDDAVAAAVDSQALVVVICSTDETYPELVPPFVTGLRERTPAMRVILAGLPEGHVESLQAAGVDDFIHIRVNCLKFLEDLQRQLGIAKDS